MLNLPRHASDLNLEHRVNSHGRFASARFGHATIDFATPLGGGVALIRLKLDEI